MTSREPKPLKATPRLIYQNGNVSLLGYKTPAPVDYESHLWDSFLYGAACWILQDQLQRFGVRTLNSRFHTLGCIETLVCPATSFDTVNSQNPASLLQTFENFHCFSERILPVGVANRMTF